MSKYKSWNGGCDTCLCLCLTEKHENFPSRRYQHDSVPSGLTPVYPKKSVMASSIRDLRVKDKGDFSFLLLYFEMNTIMDQLCLSRICVCGRNCLYLWTLINLCAPNQPSSLLLTLLIYHIL